MNVFVDTSVWSLAFRRSSSPQEPSVRRLEACLERGDTVVTTGIVLQELLQGVRGPVQASRIAAEFSPLPVIVPEIEDPIEAAALRNQRRRNGVRVGTIVALLARLCIRHELSMLSTDKDFEGVARHTPLVLMRP